MTGRTRMIVAALAIGVVVGILWLDVTTGIWQELVVTSGIAAGLVTFVLTVLGIDRVLDRSSHERWAPVTQLALGDILHALADEDATDDATGQIVPRMLDELPAPGDGDDAQATVQLISALLVDVGAERSALAATLGTWSSFLASSSDVDSVLTAAADFAERLDLVGGELRSLRGSLTRVAASPGVDVPSSAGRVQPVNEAIQNYNAAVMALVRATREAIRDHGAQRGSTGR